MKKSQIQIAIDKITAEINALVVVRERLVEAQGTPPPKRKPRAKVETPKTDGGKA